MKKFITTVFVLFLVVPVISDAGSVTSSWDMKVGGFVMFEGGWASQAQNGNYFLASPESYGGNNNMVDEYPNIFMAAGRTRLNFSIKGPEGWGAKTSAFVEGDFTSSDGALRLRHAYMKFDWGTSSLVIGQTWQRWGLLRVFNSLGLYELAAMNVGTRLPQITFTQKFAKRWAASFSIMSPHETKAVGGSRASSNILSGTSQQTIFGMPFFESEVTYETDTCGKIGQLMTKFGLGGFVGRAKTARRSGAAGTDWQDDDQKTWGVAFKGFIPIIPAKKENKAGAFAIDGQVFMTSGQTGYFPGFTYDAYTRTASIDAAGNFDARRVLHSGGWGQLTYYLTNSVYINALYGTACLNWSDTVSRDAVNGPVTTAPRSVQHYILTLIYNVNPAVQLGIGYTHIVTGYVRNQALGRGGKSGKLDAGRVAATYFF